MPHRIRSLDVLRISAVLLVVLQHAATFLPAAQRLNPAFLVFDRLASCDAQVLFLISGFLAGLHPRPPRTETGRIFTRLLLPYAFWAVFYTSMFDLEALWQRVQPRLPNLAGVLTGQGVYFILWFLPMLVYCSLIGSLVRDERSCFTFSAASFLVWLGLAFTVHSSTIRSYANSNIGFARQLPYFLALYLFAKWIAMSNRAIQPTPLLPVVSFATLVVAADTLDALWMPAPGLLAFHAAVDMVIAAALAVALLLLALRFPGTGEWLPSFWATSAPYSIYLTHMLVLTATAHFLPLIGSTWLVHIAALGLAGFAGTSVLTALALRIPLLRPVFGQPVSSHL